MPHKKMPVEKFEDWLKTPRGQKAESSFYMRPNQTVYLRNCLWWAFHAGKESGDIQYTETGNILREIMERGKLPLTKNLISRIKYIVNEHEK